jgi:rare lipoprotein A
MQRELQGELVDEPPLSESPAVTMKATYYANRFHGRKTTSGERYDKTQLTCAHRKFPFNTLLKIKNPDNGKEVIVRVNDRGPFARGFDLDISYEAAQQLGMIRDGVKKLQVRVLGVNGQEVAQGSK